MAADNRDEAAQKQRREDAGEVVRLICATIKERRGLKLDEMERVLCAWARDPGVLDLNTGAGKEVYQRIVSAVGGGAYQFVHAQLGAIRGTLEKMNPGMHAALNEHEELVFGFALEALEAGVEVFHFKDPGTPVPLPFYSHLAVLHNYFPDAKLFVRKNAGWALRPAFIRAAYLHFTGDKHERRGMALRLAADAAAHYAVKGHIMTPECAATRSASDELRVLMLPHGWIEIILASQVALGRLRAGAPAPCHALWIEACMRNLLALLRDAARQNQLPVRLLALRPFNIGTGRNMVEELERLGVFREDEVKRDVPEAALVPLDAGARTALLAKMEGRWKGAAPASDGPLENFTLALHAELGPDCEVCLSAPKQVVFEECAHVFMCESCFTGGYERKGECPICKTVSGVARLLPMPITPPGSPAAPS